MNRRKFLHLGAMAAGTTWMMPTSLLAATRRQAGWKINMLGEKTGVFTESGGAILFSFTTEGIVVVDSQFPQQATNLVNEIRNRNQQPYRLLINTHHHPDHTGGNLVFRELTNKVLAHANSKINQQKQAVERKNEDKQLYPNMEYQTTWSETIGNDKISLHYFGAGHTNGDSVVHFERENIAHMGDLCFNKIVPNIDTAAGGSVTSWIATLDKTYSLLDTKTKVICSHGKPVEQVMVNREFLKDQKRFFETIMDFTSRQIKSGKTKEEIVAITSIPGTDGWTDEWKFLKKNLAAAYDELGGK